MNSLRSNKSATLAVTVLLTASLSLANTQPEKHEKPVKHKAEHHDAPKAVHHDVAKHDVAKHDVAKHDVVRHDEMRVAHPETPKPAHHSTKKSRKRRPRGQQAIDSARTREIQEALIREHYMTGKPSGDWDSTTQDAMRHYQADQGWQSKSVPDSRALIRLGLGPGHEHLLNPESAMTSEASLPQASKPVSVPASAPSSTQASSAQAANSSATIQPAANANAMGAPAADISPSR